MQQQDIDVLIPGGVPGLSADQGRRSDFSQVDIPAKWQSNRCGRRGKTGQSLLLRELMAIGEKNDQSSPLSLARIKKKFQSAAFKKLFHRFHLY